MGGIKSRLQNIGKNHGRPSRSENEGSTIPSTNSARNQFDEAISIGTDRTNGVSVPASNTGSEIETHRGKKDTIQTTTNPRSRT